MGYKQGIVRAAFVFAGVGLTTNAAIAQAPQAEIRSGDMKASFYLPDAQRGFYRGVRFDWGGVLFDLRVAGHNVYRPWFSSTDPGVPDYIYKDGLIVAGPNTATTGPAEEFQKPIGYEAAKPGETFLKIGVGLLRKPDDKKYSFTTQFALVDGGHWTTSRTADSITFEQTYGSASADYGYVYTKTYRLLGAAHQMLIEHRLKNVGRQAISTTVYDHNFFTLDGETVGTGYTLTAPYRIQSNRPVDPALFDVEGNTVHVARAFGGEDHGAMGLQGFSDAAKDYDFLLQSKGGHLQVRIAGNRPLVNALLWSIRSVIAVEPFVAVEAAPGHDFTWQYTYTFTAIP